MSPAVLHVAQPGDAGVARWIVDHASRQRAAGWNAVVACAPGSWLADQLVRRGVPVLDWSAQRAPHRAVAAEMVRLRRIVTVSRPDLVHLHSAKAGLDGRLLLRGRRPTVFSPHAWSFDAVTGQVARAALAWERAAAGWTDRLLCVSRAESDAGAAAGIHVCATVVPNGVDLSRHRSADDATRRAARAGLGLAEDAPLAVCVGRLCPQKGQDLLLDAWQTVRAELPDARLALVGAGEDAPALRARAPEDVLMPGAVGDANPWYAAANVIAVPSRWEGMALVPLEAMAAARAVVGFDVTGMSESIPGEAGALVPAGDVAALASALAARLRDLPATDAEGSRGRRHVEHAHDVDVLAEEVLDVYRDVLGLTAGDASSRSPSSR